MVVGVGFFSFVALGMPGGLLNVAWSPAIRETFGLSLDAVGLMYLASTLGYCLASSATGRLTARLGMARLLVASSVFGALGLLGIAIAPGWGVLLGLSLLTGAGGGILDGGMNIYFAASFGPRLMNWLHACFGIGATIGPWLMTAILKGGGSWRWGYGVAALLYAVLTALLLLTARRWRMGREAASSTGPRTAAARETLRLPFVWLGIGLFMVYTGLEVSAGQWSFSLFTDARGVALDVAGMWVGIYWGSFTVGRILFGAIVEKVRAEVLIRLCIGVEALAALLLWWSPVPMAGFLALALFGFAHSPIFALMITYTQERLGPVHAPNAIGLEVGAAGVGVGVLPGLAGVLAEKLGLEIVPWFLLAGSLAMLLLYEAIQSQRPAAQPAPVPQAD
jgi:fucose permease